MPLLKKKLWYLPDGTVTGEYQPGAVSDPLDLLALVGTTERFQAESERRAGLLPDWKILERVYQRKRPKTEEAPAPGLFQAEEERRLKEQRAGLTPAIVPEVKATIPPAVPPVIPPEVGGSLANLIQRLYPESYAEGVRLREPKDVTTDLLIRQFRADLQNEPELFLKSLRSKNLPGEERALLEYLQVPESLIDEIIGVEERENEIQRAIDAIPELKGQTIDSLTKLLETDPQGFFTRIMAGGITHEKKALLKIIGYSEDEIGSLLRIPRPVGTAIDKGALAIQAEIRERDKRIAEGKQGIYGRVFTAGVGGLLDNAGGVFRWLGAEGIGDKISQAGQFMQVQATPLEKGEFKWQEMFDPTSYSFQSTARGIIEATPTLMTLMIPGFVAYGLAGKAAVGVTARLGLTGTKLGSFTRTVITGIGGSAIQSPLEGAMEAAQSYDEARARGLSHEEANKLADSVFKKNVAMLGITNLAQLIIAFAPIKGRATASIIKRGLVTTSKVGGKVIITGLTEGGEEIYQDALQRQAKGEKFKLDADAQQVFAIGAVMGLGMGAGGDILVRITDKVAADLTPQKKAQFVGEVRTNKAKGLDESQSKVQAMDKVVESNPDVAKSVETAAQEVNRELTQEQLDKIQKKPPTEPPSLASISEKIVTRQPLSIEEQQFIDKQPQWVKDGLKKRQPFPPTTEPKVEPVAIPKAVPEAQAPKAVPQVTPTKPPPVAPEVTPAKPVTAVPAPTKEAMVAPEAVTPAPEVITQAKLPSGTIADIVETEPGRIWEIRVRGERAGELIKNYGKFTVFGGGESFSVPSRAEGFRKLEQLASEQEKGILRRPGEVVPTPTTEGVVKPEAVRPYAELEAQLKDPEWLRARIAELEKRSESPKISLQRRIDARNELTQMRSRLSELEVEAPAARPEPAEGMAEEAAPSPLLSVPEETTLPMPDEVTVSEDRVVMPPPPPKEPPPSIPSPTHPPQPAPIVAGRITMPDLQAPQTVVDMYSRPDFWRRVANLPLVKKAVGLFNPAAVANNPAQQAIILRAALKDEGAQKAQAVMSHLWEIGTQERVWGKTDEMGLLTGEPFTGISIDDIRQNPSKFSAQMTEQQKEWTKRASEIEKVKLEALKRNGIDINELSFEDGGEYAGRRVMGKFNDSGELIESGRIGIGGRVGAKMPFEKTRVFKTAQEGIEANYRYMNSDEALYYNTLGAYNKIADRQMADWILSKVDWRTTKAPEALVLQAEAARLRLRKAQQLAGALNRAVRGERVPSNTINSIASAYADQADTLKTLIPELQKPSPETADTVQILTAEAKALISEARLEYYQAVNERARAREEAMRVKYEEASIAHPAFAGKIFTGTEAKEIADILNRGLSPQFIEALGDVNKVNAIGRFFMLAGDASPMSIQLQFLAFYRPKAYVKAWGGFVKALYDPEFQYRYYAKNRDLINRHPTLILSGRGTEFTEFMGRGGLGKKLGVLAKPLVPFQKAFEGSLDVAGIELAKSLDHLATTPQRTLEVDQFINEFRGVTSSARIGVSSTQRQAETAILLAPRYNRAIAAYLFDIVHGGIRGHQARMSLAQGFAGLAAMAVAISIALSEDDDEIWQHFDPTSPKFFTWDVMGVKIGLGGKVRSIIKTFGNMTRTGEVGQPALNFLRGNLSPGASTGLDLLTGKNYIGEPTRDNILDFSKTILRNFMMIWTQNFLQEGGTLKDKAIIATAEFLGLRGYDISAKKELKIKDLADRLGEQVGKTPVLTKKKPDIYDTRNIFSDVKRIIQNIPPEDVLVDKGFAGWGHLVVKIEQSEANSLPNIAFKDYNFDTAKGDTLDSYFEQWAERQRIEEAGERVEYTRVKIVEGKEERTTFKGLQALAAHKVDYPNARRGNLSKRDRELLLEYNAAVNKKQFIKDHPEIEVNKLTDWLKSHPRENAEFALVGQADILSKETYNQYKKLIVEMDTPDAALLKNVLPPEISLDTHFSYVDMVAKGAHSSWEAQLLLKQDALKAKEAGAQSYVEWRTDGGEPLKLSDTPIASLELKVKNRANFDKLDGFSDEDSSDYIADEKKRTEAVKKFRSDNPNFVDDTRRIEVLEKGTDEKPIDEKLVSAHVGYGKLIDQEGIGSSSAEAMLYRVDNPDYDAFRTDTAIWDKQSLTPIDQSRIPIWRIDVKYRKEDDEYNAIKNPLPAEQARLRAEYMATHEAYRKDDRRREAYGLSNPITGVRLPTTEVENYVAFYEIPQKGKRQERFVVENPEFAQAMFAINGRDIYKTRPEDVPNVAYDDIYDQFADQFDELDGLGKATAYGGKYFKETEAERETRRNELRFTEVSQNYSGVEIVNEQMTDFGLAELRRDAYGKFVPEQHIEDYVGYYTIYSEGKPQNWEKATKQEFWFEDDWFLKEHPDFYKEVYLNPKYWAQPHERKDFRLVPDQQVFAKWLYYNTLTNRKSQDAYRLANPDLDAWGSQRKPDGSVFIWSVTMTELRRRMSITPSERFREGLEAKQEEFEKRLAGVR